MSNELVDRLRGKYPVGPDGVYGTRDFSNFIPPICGEAADTIEKLEKEIKYLDAKIDAAIMCHPKAIHTLLSEAKNRTHLGK